MTSKKLATTPRSRIFFAFVAAILLSIVALAVALAYGNSVTIDGTLTDWADELTANDEEGVDDCTACSGQKDLTKAGIASNWTSSTPANTLYVLWHWDDTGETGANTADGCALFDTDADSYINWSLCASASGNPLGDPPTATLYECTADSATLKCMGDTARTFSGSCRLNSAATDPFTHSGNVCNGTNCLTQDAAVECSLPISNISLSGNLVFQNICSYPSAQPNSDPSDCVLAPTTRLAVNIQTGDNYKSGLSPTAITLSSFTARAENARIIVAWTTLSEFNNAGFNLYRSDRADGNFVRINDVLIPSQTGGALTGAEYAWTDNSAQPGVTYYYKLEDVDIYGTTSWHGPVSAARQPFASFPIFLPLVTAR